MHSEKVRLVYNPNGKISVLIESFDTAAEMEAGLIMVTNVGWKGSKANSYRTRRMHHRRMEVFIKHFTSDFFRYSIGS